MSGDEYEQYSFDFDIEDLPYITTLPPSPLSPGKASQGTQEQNSQNSDADVFYTAPSTQDAAYHSDSYSDYDFTDFTVDDFAAIDAAIAAVSGDSQGVSKRKRSLPTNGVGGPSLPVVLEQQRKAKGSSPYDRFRAPRGTLSVTDLTGPSWCEVQFDYGLRQMRFKRVDNRPSEFRTAAGKTIVVDKTVAAENDQITRRGKSVHKALERELHPEVVPVEAVTNEERWGLRLINMITSMQSLLYNGRCREMNVFGVIHSQVVVGVIDEVERKPILTTEPVTHASREPGSAQDKGNPAEFEANEPQGSSSPTQPHLTDPFLSPDHQQRNIDETPDAIADEFMKQGSWPSSQASSQLPEPRFSLHLSDTKTRRHPSLPTPEDTIGTHMQLMLYHRLLSNLLPNRAHPEDELDFQWLWTRLGLDHRRPFSQEFKDTAGLILGSDSLRAPVCLDDLTSTWKNVVEMLNISGVDETLTAVYRTQPTKRKRKRRGNASPQDAWARQESANLSGCDRNGDTADGTLEPFLSTGETTASGSPHPYPADSVSPSELGLELEDDAALQWAIQESLLEHARQRPQSEDVDMSNGQDSSTLFPPDETLANGSEVVSESVEPLSSSMEETESSIIGTKIFKMDNVMLDGYLKNILDWWYGRRPPKGVEVHLTKRCLSCEYQEGCEWREQKAADWRNSKGRGL